MAEKRINKVITVISEHAPEKQQSFSNKQKLCEKMGWKPNTINRHSGKFQFKKDGFIVTKMDIQ